MPRPSNTAERRSQIARGFMKALAAQGYQGASIKTVAKEAGLTQGLIHYHFKNKQEILLAVLEELLAHQSGVLRERLTGAGASAIGQLHAFIDFHLRIGKDADPVKLACWIAISEEAMRQDDVRQAFEAAIKSYVTKLTGIIELGVKRKELTCAKPRSAAVALVAAVQGYYMLAATAREQIPKGSAAPSVRAMADGLLRHEHKAKTKKG